MRRRPKAPSRPMPQDYDYGRPAPAKPGFGSLMNSLTLAVLAGVFVLGLGIGIAFSSTANFSPENVASREVIDRSAPSPELCVRYGASAVTMDLRAFVTLNPFNVYVSQPVMQPGCILRSNNWSLLERSNRVTSEEVRQCKNRMNTFGFTGDVDDQKANVKVDCVYQNDSAGNLFLNQPGFGDARPESEKF